MVLLGDDLPIEETKTEEMNSSELSFGFNVFTVDSCKTFSAIVTFDMVTELF